jgi:hypothetical protein
MATKLGIYNDAMRALGERPLLSVTEATAPRRAMDSAWDDVLASCLEDGLWRHALRTVELGEDNDVGATFGYEYVYTLPSDFVRLAELSADPRFSDPLWDYRLEGKGRLYANVEPIYLSYVSNDAEYGGDLTAWPQFYAEAVGADLAVKISLVVNQNRTDRNDLIKIAADAMARARSRDAMDKPNRRFPVGRLVRSRMGSGYQNRG